MPSQKKPNRLLWKEEQNVRQKHAENYKRVENYPELCLLRFSMMLGIFI